MTALGPITFELGSLAWGHARRVTSSQPASIELFGRVGRGLKLTVDGEQLAGAVVPALATISDALKRFVDPRFIEAELAAGQLTMPFDGRLPLDTGYWLVWRPDREGSRPLAAFRQWLAEELAPTRRRRSPDDHERRERA